MKTNNALRGVLQYISVNTHQKSFDDLEHNFNSHALSIQMVGQLPKAPPAISLLNQQIHDARPDIQIPDYIHLRSRFSLQDCRGQPMTNDDKAEMTGRSPNVFGKAREKENHVRDSQNPDRFHKAGNHTDNPDIIEERVFSGPLLEYRSRENSQGSERNPEVSDNQRGKSPKVNEGTGQRNIGTDGIPHVEMTGWLLPPPPPSHTDELTWEKVSQILQDGGNMAALPEPMFIEAEGMRDEPPKLCKWPHYYLDRYQPYKVPPKTINGNRTEEIQAYCCMFDEIPELEFDSFFEAEVVQTPETTGPLTPAEQERKTKLNNWLFPHTDTSSTSEPYGIRSHWLDPTINTILRSSGPQSTQEEPDMKVINQQVSRHRFDVQSALWKDQFHGNKYIIAAHYNGSHVGVPPNEGDFVRRLRARGELIRATGETGATGRPFHAIAPESLATVAGKDECLEHNQPGLDDEVG